MVVIASSHLLLVRSVLLKLLFSVYCFLDYCLPFSPFFPLLYCLSFFYLLPLTIPFVCLIFFLGQILEHFYDVSLRKVVVSTRVILNQI